MDKILAIINHDKLCWKCLQDKEVKHNIIIPEMGYGSRFDEWSTEVHLCDECYQESTKNNQEMWSMEEIPCKINEYAEHGCTEYKYENEMLMYIDSLPLQGKQFVMNEFRTGYMYPMAAQDWIDNELGILSHEECKLYNLYSPEEINAYKRRYPFCEYVVNNVWNDDSKSSGCPFGAIGGYGQACNWNISSQCYECNYFTSRITPIKDINNSEFKDYMEYLRMTIKKDELEKKFG